jgi:L-alanine-DL-glutamate epimerase-like enolase superfamily enzyme
MELAYEVVELVPTHVFRTARTASAMSESVIVRLSDGTLSGVGEAAPSRYYGETAESVVGYLERARPAVERAEHESEVMAYLTSRGGRGDPAARASLEIAAHDMMGKRFGVPLYRHFGLEPEDAPLTTISIGIDDPDAMVEKALEVSGHPILKVKLDAEIDVSIVARIKDATGAAVTVDANCSWSVDESVEKIAELASIGVEFVEQPVVADDVAGLRHVREHSAVPIYADESCPTSADVAKVADAVDGVVVKFMKGGGYVDALRMVEEARARGLKTMIGCMLESSIGITAAAHVSPLMDYADLDSAFLLSNDPYAGMTIDRGRIVLPDEPGLGVREVALQEG